ncbi:hypothetical protein SLEP1_g40993 [Rubroshorea leprosula]|uniref:non-specific serine/threonine protein kinase n=1 Tax=Rubroshorea leprosula TaxID=152421 RepID=A0AAV5L6F0_9ROSI|nr:hypothetical protein SLEP1_g40993 [Rubroshorea leprosula]
MRRVGGKHQKKESKRKEKKTKDREGWGFGSPGVDLAGASIMACVCRHGREGWNPLIPTSEVSAIVVIRGVIIGGIIGGAASLLIVGGAIAFAWWRRRKRQNIFHDVSDERDPEVHLAQLKRFSLQELQVATDYFSNKNILGRGGSRKVYKGCLVDGSLVAIKRLQTAHTPGAELQFQTELKMISMAVHRNLLRLRGFCMTRTERLLVYPYMANGSVASCLRERPPSQPPLDWPTRKRIALGSAKGLSYLHHHCNPKIIHRDVKATNILLDEEFEAVVGYFGLAILMDYKDTRVTTAVRGTVGHIGPKYLSPKKALEKTDVYGYGIMLLELITGQRAFDPTRPGKANDVMLVDWVEGFLMKKKLEMLVDPDLQNKYVESEVEQLTQIAMLCTQDSPKDRPQMLEVVRMLEGDGSSERWDEWQRLEIFQQEFKLTSHLNTNWIVDSTENQIPVELSGVEFRFVLGFPFSDFWRERTSIATDLWSFLRLTVAAHHPLHRTAASQPSSSVFFHLCYSVFA